MMGFVRIAAVHLKASAVAKCLVRRRFWGAFSSPTKVEDWVVDGP